MFFSRGRQALEQRLERLAELHVLDARVVDAHGVEHRHAALVGVVAGVQRQRRVGVAGLDALDDVVHRAADAGGQLGRRRRPAQRLGELRGGAADLHPQLLQPPRHPDRPALVAEVALDLADDRRGGVRRELDAAVGVEAVDGLDQPDGADLDEVLERLAAVAEAARAVLDQRQVQAHQAVAGRRPLRVGGVGVARTTNRSALACFIALGGVRLRLAPGGRVSRTTCQALTVEFIVQGDAEDGRSRGGRRRVVRRGEHLPGEAVLLRGLRVGLDTSR